MIYKETTASGETLIYMNGALLYKKYPTGDSVLFEKYGLQRARQIVMPGTIDLAAAYELAAQWHDKHSRGAREIADDIRVGADIQPKARVASQHHDASAAGLRLAAIEQRRKRSPSA